MRGATLRNKLWPPEEFRVVAKQAERPRLDAFEHRGVADDAPFFSWRIGRALLGPSVAWSGPGLTPACGCLRARAAHGNAGCWGSLGRLARALGELLAVGVGDKRAHVRFSACLRLSHVEWVHIKRLTANSAARSLQVVATILLVA